MRKLRDFECDRCGHAEERLVKDDELSFLCPICPEGVLERIISGGNFHLDHLSGHFESGTRKWAKWRQQQIAKEKKDNS